MSLEEKPKNEMIRHHDIEDLGKFVRDLTSSPITNKKDYEDRMRDARRQYHQSPSKSDMFMAYRLLVDRGEIESSSSFERYGVKKEIRSIYGVLVVTVFTSAYPGVDKNGNPKSFDCEFDCAYCPEEPGQPRSYLSTEPGVMRAIRNEYDPVRQFDDRLQTLINCGHIPDKVEILVLGGTWSSYPIEYRNQFILMTYYAANTFFDRYPKNVRTTQTIILNDSNEIVYLKYWKEFINWILLFLPFSHILYSFFFQKLEKEKEKETEKETENVIDIRIPLTLLEERKVNETAKCRIIGITLETRPDCISPVEIKRFREYGCTRMQIGIQHTDDEILDHVNRRCKNKHNIRGIRMLKEAGFKVDIHLMPDLPGSTPEKDRAMFEYVLNSPDMQADQWKIYPCSVTPFTKIAEWYESGEYKPYAETNWNEFYELLIWVKTNVHPRIRLNRIIRDIPNESIIGGNTIVHLRTILHQDLKKRGLRCRCIRCREVKYPPEDIDTLDVNLYIDEYQASGGTEFYISIENEDQTVLYGHLRLRINGNSGKNIFPELIGSSMIRELHVYGKLISVSDKTKYKNRAQHRGFGSRMLLKAEEITKAHGLNKIAVISGDGVKEYYRNYHQYLDEGEYLTKILT